jgi:trigger factor
VKLTTERKPGSLIELNITADEQEFNNEVDKVISRQAKNVQIPGFRKGKAPRQMVERFYGGREAFQQDAAEGLMDKYYREALEKEDIRTVGEPEVTSLSFDPTLNFVVSVPVYPDVELGDYKEVRVDPIDAAVSDEEVQDVVTRLQKQASEWVDLAESRKPVEGDQVTIDYTVKEGDNDFQEPVNDAVWVLGETNLLPQLRERIEDMEVGETSEFDVLFEEDDETADPQIRGKLLHYTVTLKAVKEQPLREMTDELAKELAVAESVDDLLQQVRDDIHQGKTNDARNQVMNSIVEKIAETTEIDIPEVMIDEEVEHQLNHRKEDLQRQGINWDQMLAMSNMSEDDIKADTRPEAERRLRNTMILQEIARLENIEVADEDLDAEIDRVAGSDLNPDENDEEAVARAKRLRDVYNSDYFRSVLRNDLFERKLTDHIIELATEGKGAVINGYVAPETEESTSGDTTASEDEGTEEDEATETRSSKLPKGGEGEEWVSGDGGDTAPDGFPIKGNANSKIYHPEESPNYTSTIADIYFATPEAAESHGYRLPKTLQQGDDEE